jgi:hypothetical protein
MAGVAARRFGPRACGEYARNLIHNASNDYNIEYKNYYSSHLAHLLVAEDGLGGKAI